MTNLDNSVVSAKAGVDTIMSYHPDALAARLV